MLQLDGNAWWKVAMTPTLTSTWVLEFDFRCAREGEIHAIGLDENDVYSSNRTFQLHGTYTEFGDVRDYYNYAGTEPGWKHYVIPVGTHYTGTMACLFFIGDHDFGSKDQQSFFRNVRVYDATTGRTDPIDFDTYEPVPYSQAGQGDPDDECHVLDDVTRYEWDHRNRLTAVREYATASAADPFWSVEHTYDHANRWIRKTVDGDGDDTTDRSTVFIYDGNQIVLHFEADTAGDLADSNLAHRYLWGPVQDQLLVDESVSGLGTAGVRHWTLGDHIGSIRDVINDNGGMELHRLFNAYGQSSIAQGDPESYTPLFSFTARPFDVETALQNNLNRWYDALVAKWLSEDPIGFAADVNPYRYVGNGPLVNVDPTGLQPPNPGSGAVERDPPILFSPGVFRIWCDGKGNIHVIQRQMTVPEINLGNSIVRLPPISSERAAQDGANAQRPQPRQDAKLKAFPPRPDLLGASIKRLDELSIIIPFEFKAEQLPNDVKNWLGDQPAGTITPPWARHRDENTGVGAAKTFLKKQATKLAKEKGLPLLRKWAEENSIKLPVLERGAGGEKGGRGTSKESPLRGWKGWKVEKLQAVPSVKIGDKGLKGELMLKFIITH